MTPLTDWCGHSARGVLKMGIGDWRSEIDQWDNNGILRGGCVGSAELTSEPRALAKQS